LSTTSEIFEKVNLKIVQRHIEERDLLNGSHFGFRAQHNTSMNEAYGHVTLNSNNNMSTAVVF
jgi:hypothetical protein